MDCDQAGPLLVEFAEGSVDEQTARRIREHVDSCDDCSGVLATVAAWQGHAMAWEDEPAPVLLVPHRRRRGRRFDPAGLFGGDWLPPSRWLPAAASVAALALATAAFLRSGPGPAPAPQQPLAAEPSGQFMNAGFDEWREDFEQRIEVDRSLLLEAVLVANDDRRQRELEALVRVLKAQMDRQALETNESLRYVVAHQLQEQERLDELARHMREASYTPAVQGGAP